MCRRNAVGSFLLSVLLAAMLPGFGALLVAQNRPDLLFSFVFLLLAGVTADVLVTIKKREFELSAHGYVVGLTLLAFVPGLILHGSVALQLSPFLATAGVKTFILVLIQLCFAAFVPVTRLV